MISNELLGISGAKLVKSDNYQSIVEIVVQTTLENINFFGVLLFQ